MKRLSRLRLTLTRKSEMRLLSVTSTRNVPISTAERMKRLSMPTRLMTKNPAMLSSRKPMRTQDLFFRMHRQQKLSALSMQEACKTFLHTVAATEHSGKFVRLPNRCFCNVLRLLRTFSKTAARHACSDHAPRAICVAESKRKCVRNTAEKSKVYI